MEIPVENTTETSIYDTTPALQFSPLQQWEIAFIYAFSCTFNPQQEIVPSYHKLPDFTPEVCTHDQSISMIVIPHIN